MSANRRRVVAAAACAAVLWAGAGCGGESGPAWAGSQASVSLTWTINGRAPSAARCTAVGGEFVMLWVSPVDPGCRGGEAGCGDALPTWTWECGGGTATTGLDFRTGPVWLSWGLVNAEGARREATSWDLRDLHAGNNGFIFNWTPGWAVPPDAAVATQWTIGGLAAGTDTCGSLGAENMRLSHRTAGGAVQTNEWPCADGAGNTGIAFRATQEYELLWELLDAAGTAVATLPETGWETHELAAGDNAFPVDFPGPAVADASLAATWTVRGAAADATSCGDALALTVRLSWRETGTTTETTDEWACGDGTGSTDVVLFSGTSYDFAWELLDPTGDALVRNDWAPFTPVPGANARTTDFLVGGRLDVTLEWADKTAGPAWGACDLPPDPVDRIGYRLEDPVAGTVVEEIVLASGGTPCVMSLSWSNVAFADYTLTVDGRAAATATATWHAACTPLTVDGVVDNTFTCQVAMVTP